MPGTIHTRRLHRATVTTIVCIVGCDPEYNRALCYVNGNRQWLSGSTLRGLARNPHVRIRVTDH